MVKIVYSLVQKVKGISLTFLNPQGIQGLGILTGNDVNFGLNFSFVLLYCLHFLSYPPGGWDVAGAGSKTQESDH